VAKTLYATKWARPNTCTAIAFLTTRVWAPNKDNWNKLTQLMKYLRGTCTLPLIISANRTAFWNGGWMQHLQSIPTCKDIVEEAYLCEEDFPLWVQPSRSSILEALWNQKS
jgi:hypothetical protein